MHAASTHALPGFRRAPLPPTVDSVYSAILHSVSGSRAATHLVSAPGWVPADQVLRTFRTTAHRSLSASPAPEPSTADEHPWAVWAASHPITVHTAGLALLAPVQTTPAGHARVVVRSGPESGFAIAVPRGEWTLGRGAGPDVELTDPYLSRRPLPLVNSPVGITVGGSPLHSAAQQEETAARPHCVVGSMTLALAHSTDQAADLRQPGLDHDPLLWPEPDQVTPVRSPSWIVYAAPIGIGVILALVIGTWWFLLLSLAGPATAAVTLRVERRRFTRETRESRRRHAHAAARVLDRLDARRQAFARGADAIAYGGASSTAAVRQREELVVIGTGHCLSTVGVRLPRDEAERARARRRLPPHQVDNDTALLILEDAPLLIPRRVRVRVTGPLDRARATVRSLVAAHLAAGSGCIADEEFPEFAGLADPLSSCRVARGTPLSSSTPARTEVVYEVHGPDADDEEPVEIHCGTDARPDRLSRPRSMGSPGPASLGQASARLGTAEPPAIGSPLSGPFAAHRLQRSTFLRLLHAGSLGAQMRTPAPLVLPGAPTTTVSDVLAHWLAAGRFGAGPLSVPLGPPAPLPEAPRGTPARGRGIDSTRGLQKADPRLRPEDQLALLDLRASGPHALIAGTTGSGKSVLLEAWLDALCRTHAPDDLRLVLLDFKGGASLSRFLSRPHTDCLITDLDEPAALRAVRSISAEIGRRERRLARTGCRDIDDLLDRARNDPAVRTLPRLLVVIDEFHVLTSLSPHIVAKFEHLTAVGRSLGVHLVLATQRPSGVVSARMRANISLRICLRVRDEADSHEVLGVPDAAWLDPHRPGIALVSDDSGIRAFRCALPGDPETGASDPHVTVTSLTDDETPEATETPEASEASEATDASEVVLPLPSRPPSLPVAVEGPPGPRHEVIAEALPERLPHTGGTFIGLVDLPDENRVARASLTAESGSLTVSGGRGRGWSTAIEACARAFHAAGLPVIHIGPRADAPHVDTAGILRLGHADAWAIDHLVADCARRRRPVVWAIDDWDEFVAAQNTSPRIDALERLLTGSAGMTFVVSGQRRGLAQRLSQTAATRIVFPPASDQDAVFFGLSASRFSGDWPPGRAVILGEAAVTDSHDGADLQITGGAPRPDPVPTAEPHRPHPLWVNTSPADSPRPSAPRSPWFHEAHVESSASAPPADRMGAEDEHSPTHGIAVGWDPAGELVTWDPAGHGHVLTLLVAEDHDGTARDAVVEGLRAQGVTVVLDRDEPHQRTAADRAASTRRPVCLVVAGGTVLRATAPALHDQQQGPALLLGSWSAESLRSAGHRTLAPIPGHAGVHWWVTGDTAIPIRLRSC